MFAAGSRAKVRSIFLLASLASLAGCSERFEKDFATCKAETLRVYGPDLFDEKPTHFLRECMYKKGWSLRDACIEKKETWSDAECYLK
jgi:hypothetical protein